MYRRNRDFQKLNSYQLYIFLCLFVALQSCVSNKHTLDKVDWILGNWEYDKENGTVFYENWSKINEKEFEGVGVLIKNGDTLFTERIQILYLKDGIYYVPTVSDQNEGKAVYFKQVPNANPLVSVFENKNHDFPQRITYELTEANSLKACVEGPQNGQNKEIFYYFKKVPR